MSNELEWKQHVGKVSATLQLFLFEMRASEVTEIFGVRPTFIDHTDVPAAFTSRGLSGGRECAIWCFDTARHIYVGTTVDEHLRYLLGVFRPLRSRLEDLRPRPVVWVRLRYESTVAGSGVGPQIDANCLAGLAELGTTLFVEVIQIEFRKSPGVGDS